MKRLKSLEFRFKFGREERTRKKKRERENPLPLLKLPEVSMLCESLFLYSHLSCHSGPHRVLSAASLPSGHKGHLFLSPFSTRQAQPEIPRYGLNPGLPQLLQNNFSQAKGWKMEVASSQIPFIGRFWSLDPMSHPYDSTLTGVVFLWGVFKVFPNPLGQTHFLELSTTCSRTHSGTSSSC